MSENKTASDLPPQEVTRKPSIPMPSLLAIITESTGISHAAAVGVIIFSCLVLFGAVFFFVHSAPPRTITITSGPIGSGFYTNAFRYSNILARQGVKLKILPSEGSLENLQRLDDPSFHVDVGFVQGGITNVATDKLVSLGSISYQPLLVFYRGAPVESLSDLTGRRLAIGPVGSGINAGLVHFMSKPYTAETVLNILHEVLRENPAK